MPYLLIRTNHKLDGDRRSQLLTEASRTVADALGKPERYVMVAVDDGVAMAFAGDDGPLAYLELKSIGLDESRTPDLSALLCDLVSEHLGVPRERIYIEFSNSPRQLWGWNGSTF